MTKEQLIEILQQEKERLFQYACYRLPNKEDAEDALQDLFLTMTSGIRKIKLSVPKPYIYRTLSNICATRLRKIHYHEALEKVELTMEVENFEDEFKVINRLLSWIPDEQSEVIRLHLHSEMTFAEIAQVLEISTSTVKSRFRYGISRIREELKRLKII